MTRAKSRSAVFAAALLLLAGAPMLAVASPGVGTGAGAAPVAGATPGADTLRPPARANAGCLPGERGFLQASLRGALQAQLDWRGALLECQGGLRGDGSGIRISLSGPLAQSGRRLRRIIGLDAQPGRSLSGPVPANVTAIFEDESRVYATRGDGHCELDVLRQEPLPGGTAAAPLRAFRVAGRGFCIDPLPPLTSGANGDTSKLYIDRFDFAAVANFTPESVGASVAVH